MLTCTLGLTASCVSSKVVREWLRRVIEEDFGLSFGFAAEDIILATGEAVSNSFIHGCRSLPKPIRINVTYDPDNHSITIEIADPGPGFDTSKPLRVEPYKDICCCGRFIIKQCVDRVSYDRRDGWFVCRLLKIL